MPTFSTDNRWLRLANTSFLWLLPLLCAAQLTVPMQYAFTLTDRVLHVSLTYTPVQSDSTAFLYGEPSFGGQTDIFNGLRLARVAPPAQLQIDSAQRRLTIYYKTRQPVTLTYEVIDTHTDAMGTRGELFRPMIQPGYFFSHGINIFLQPQVGQVGDTLRQSVRWATPPPYRVFFGSNPYFTGNEPFVQTVDAMLMSPITGATDLSVDRHRIGAIDNFVVLHKTKLDSLNKQAVRTYMVAYDRSIRSFWNDCSDSYFSLIIEPFLRVNHDVSGIAFSTGFIGKYVGDTILTRHRMDVISHEIAHHWIGQRVAMPIAHQWFNEDFTDYTYFYCLLRAGLITPNGFADRINQTSQQHYTSAIRQMPNDSIYKSYWKLGDYQRVPYWRGSLFAFYLDNQIVMASHRQHDIRDLLRELYTLRKHKGDSYVLTIADFVETAAHYLPRKQVQTAIDRYILRGEPISFTAAMTGPDWTITTRNEVPQFSLTAPTRFGARFIRP